MSRASASVAATAVAALVLLQGCGGGGIDFANLEGHLVAVSFVGFIPTPGGPYSYTPLPLVFRDQTLEFTFDKPLEPDSLGGFLTNGGSPVEMVGTGAVGPEGIPYLPFADQAAARHSLQLRRNEAGGPEHYPYVVGRHRDKPDTVVVDPHVVAGNPFGLPASLGFLPFGTYVVMIPDDNGFRFGAFRAEPFGAAVADLPIPIPPYTTQPALSRLFAAGYSFGPDPVPPEVVSIAPLTGGPAASFLIMFSKYVMLDSIDPLRNLVVRNLDVTTPSSPNGIIVPGSITPLVAGSQADLNVVFTPAAPYGPGVSPTQGFQIEIRVGTFGQPGVPPILGYPIGISGTQLPLSNSLAQVFDTAPCFACQTPSSVVESFDDTFKRDPTFFPPFGPVSGLRWNDASAPGKLAGRYLSGSPSGASPASLGTRIQIITGNPYSGPQPVFPLFSPFDASLANSGGECPTSPTGCNLGINQQGGSHIMHIYEAAELGNVEDSLEQIEWRPFDGVTHATVYPQYTIWCGLTSTAAPLGGGGATGLTSVYDANYNLTPYQIGSLIPQSCASPTAPSPRKVFCGGFLPYVVPLRATQFHPFPVLNPCFDFATSTGQSGPGVNLLLEQNIASGNQVPNFNTSFASGPTPIRRLVARPLAQVLAGVCPFNEGGGSEAYRMRFTFVGLSGQARSLWYDTGASDPTYLGFIETPNHAAQPYGTQTVLVLEGTDVANPGPATPGVGGTYISAAGVVNPAVLTALSGLRYFRFRVELRGNNLANTTPAYASFVMAYTQ